MPVTWNQYLRLLDLGTALSASQLRVLTPEQADALIEGLEETLPKEEKDIEEDFKLVFEDDPEDNWED